MTTQERIDEILTMATHLADRIGPDPIDRNTSAAEYDAISPEVRAQHFAHHDAQSLAGQELALMFDGPTEDIEAALRAARAQEHPAEMILMSAHISRERAARSTIERGAHLARMVVHGVPGSTTAFRREDVLAALDLLDDAFAGRDREFTLNSGEVVPNRTTIEDARAYLEGFAAEATALI